MERTIDGGTNTNRNLILLHPDCHRTVRAFGLSVMKPARSKWAQKSLSEMRRKSHVSFLREDATVTSCPSDPSSRDV
ncbi:HNH endonuclease [Paraburkholderia sediminicola]|nr:HNH endonuclease [Paraburkholderia sediminicola]